MTAFAIGVDNTFKTAYVLNLVDENILFATVGEQRLYRLGEGVRSGDVQIGTSVEIEIDDVCVRYAAFFEVVNHREHKARLAATTNARYDFDKIAFVKAADLVQIVFALENLILHIFYLNINIANIA